MARVHDTVNALRTDSKYVHVTCWAGLGFCWGSKSVSLITAAGDKSLLHVAAHTSPSRLDPEEAKTITVPTMLLPSKGEDKDLVKKYVDNLKGEKYVERFDEVHGWMSARKEYERGY
ncbi:Dienelactone hydrolase [Fusarium albosuccineum]|uniref:Dienelactone hydrolase n=1 Tax=Fusarium albosuccineum TaxID=1237068 RepID=A0A8H4LMX9_9HYPO|nr:Dienelactone hydrolase [Fusarium albosuccineum]